MSAYLMIPAAIAAYVILNPIVFCYPWAGFYPGYRATTVAVLVFIAAWVLCVPLRRCCEESETAKPAYYGVPFCVLAVLYLSQWHPAIAFAFAFVGAALGILFVLCCVRVKHRTCEGAVLSPQKAQKIQKQYRRMFTRYLVVAVFAICLIPALIAGIVLQYRPLRFVPDTEIAEEVTGKDGQAQYSGTEEWIAEYATMNCIGCLAEDKWETYDIRERISILQSEADWFAQFLDIEEIPVSAVCLKYPVVGRYIRDEGKIEIDLKTVAEKDAMACTGIIAHEVYHGFQHDMVDAAEASGWENMDEDSSWYREVAQWKAELENYVRSEDSENFEYENQEVEIMANAFANAQCMSIQEYLLHAEDSEVSGS